VIVTRKRRKPFPFKRLLLPLIAIGLVAFALLWPPSRNAMTSGPLAPVARTAGAWFDNVAAPFHFAAQNEVITDRNKQIAVLQGQLTDAQNTSTTKDKKIADLQQQVGQLQTQLATSTGNTQQATARGAKLGQASPRPGASVPGLGSNPNAGAIAQAGDLSDNATPDMKRTAQYWASMDPENVAKVAQRLPPTYVARILALMSTDAAGTILDSLPPAFAAKLTQEHPELQR
jgi:flagellar motility protein MotE (MotC chaperone)